MQGEGKSQTPRRQALAPHHLVLMQVPIIIAATKNNAKITDSDTMPWYTVGNARKGAIVMVNAGAGAIT